MRKLAELLQRRCANVPSWNIGNSQESRIVVRVRDQAQVGENVLDLAAIEECRAAADVIRHARQAQCFFERTRLMVAAIEDREIHPFRLVLLGDVRQISGDAFGFVLVVLAFHHADRRAFGQIAEELLEMLVWIVRDELVGRAKNALAAAVILFELDDLECRIVPREIVEIFQIRAAPCVDRLIVVAHRGEGAARPAGIADQPVLCRVRVLVFVDEQIADAFLPGVACFLILFEQRQRQADQIVKIDGIECGKAFLIALVQLRGFEFARTTRRGEVLASDRARCSSRSRRDCAVPRVDRTSALWAAGP